MTFSQTQFQTLFAYHWHTNQRLLACAAKLGEAVYHENPGYGHGSIHDLFFHILRTDRGWRMALETGQQQATSLQGEDFPTLASLEAGCEDEQAAWQTLLNHLSGQEVEDTANLTTLRGQMIGLPRWRVFQHLILHGMQHHTEIAHLLTAKGQSPGDIDFIFFQ